MWTKYIFSRPTGFGRGCSKNAGGIHWLSRWWSSKTPPDYHSVRWDLIGHTWLEKANSLSRLLDYSSEVWIYTLQASLPVHRNMWICDTWHMTCDTWHMSVGGRWTLSRNLSSLSLMVWEWTCFKDFFLQRIAHWLEWIN